MGEATSPANKNIFIGLMQLVNKIGYTPFFHLCERDKSFKKNNDNYPKMIKLLLGEVDKEERPECFENHTSKHSADAEFVHEETKYTCLHWLAYHDDADSIAYIIDDIGKHIESDTKTFIKLMQRTKLHKMTPMCIAGSKEKNRSLIEFIKFFS